MIDKHGSFGKAKKEEADLMSLKMLEYIFPNTPASESQKEAFNKAVLIQIDHEKTVEENSVSAGEAMPASLISEVKSVSIGHFSFALKDNSNSYRLSKSNICPFARALLLREGLLYKGLPSDCCCGGDD